MEISPDIAARIEARLERSGETPDALDRAAGLPAGTVAALCAGRGRLPTGQAFRRLCAALGVDEAFVLGLQPGDLVPAGMLEEPQGQLGLLAPDEEAMLRHYRRLDIPARAAFLLVLTRAAGPEPEAAPDKPRRGAKR